MQLDERLTAVMREIERINSLSDAAKKDEIIKINKELDETTEKLKNLFLDKD